ncbi:TPA: hypothetical protein HA372_00155 [Candidatus Woesearchaeota archaeon]|nr:MAG: hypothetical protein QT04_C0037G0006 [archaeon GW2011_AR11]HIH05124.1 hypothetical protein [Candidatus Woesearchaeota archaeon]HII64653.1 hypothetical protein [Candidatus Woesearchaeota archaeon]HIJ18088.1 hypothetical protein [Candidatus Woesearchaeota archaeon]
MSAKAKKEGGVKKESRKKERREGLLSFIWNGVRKNKISLAVMLFLDAAFIAALLLLGSLVMAIAPSLRISSILSMPLAAIWYAVSLMAAYALILLLVYSFVKYMVLHYVRSLFTSSALSFSRFWGFYALNVLLLVIFGFVFILISYFIGAVKQPFAAVGLLVTGIPFFLVLLICLNTAHALYHSSGDNPIRTLGKSLSFIFTGMGAYVKVLGAGVGFLLVVWVLLYLTGLAIYSTAASDYQRYVSLYNGFRQASEVLGPAIIYLFVIFNRLGFYAVVLRQRHDPAHH